ncbi:MAG: arginyltransferase [SAR324 cluster bacterium]|nr:arginyltransferase [SAR324 cluster bacterium]
MTQTIQLYRTNNGPCPYRSVGIWENVSFEVKSLSVQVFQDLLDVGFRRSGCSIYRPDCRGCRRCIPIRLDCDAFRMSKGQRRTWRKNEDLQIEHRSVEFDEEIFKLYQRYQIDWHQTSEIPELEEFENFLIQTPVKTEMIRYSLENKLLGVSWVDHLPSGLSSEYFIFHPEYASRRLGVYSILYEIEYCQKLKHPWLYLGYFVGDSPKMNYKADYQPAQVFLKEQWQYMEKTVSFANSIFAAGSTLRKGRSLF